MLCKYASIRRAHRVHVPARIIRIFLGGARSVCSLQEAGAEGFLPFSDRACHFSFPLSWIVRRRQPAVPSGAASSFHPLASQRQGIRPNPCLPTCKLAAVGFVLCLVALIEICAINLISRTAVRGKPCRWESLIIAKKTPAERKWAGSLSLTGVELMN